MVTWLQYSPATVEVPGTNPTDALKLNFFLVTTKWGHVGKKRFPIFKSGLFRFLPPEGARRYDIISAYRSDRKLKHSGPLLVVRGGLALLDLLPLCIIHFWNHWLKLDKMGVILTLN